MHITSIRNHKSRRKAIFPSPGDFNEQMVSPVHL